MRQFFRIALLSFIIFLLLWSTQILTKWIANLRKEVDNEGVR